MKKNHESLLKEILSESSKISHKVKKINMLSSEDQF